MTPNSKKHRLKPSLPQNLRRKSSDAGVLHITNESVAEHREEVLGKARKFIYPLRHSRYRVVKISVGIFVLAIVIFLVGCAFALYRFQSTSSFVYGVTRVIPFPVARADGRFVSYESYLFELRHYMHYYSTQQDADFNTSSGQRQLASFKTRSLNQAIDNAYVAQLAKENHVGVSGREVNQQVALARSQNRLGASNEVFKSVLKQFWGWSVDDFKRELRQEMLDQKVAAALDKDTTTRAQSAYAQLQGGADFATVAKAVSDDDATKDNGGDYGFDITRSNRDLPPKVVDELFNLQKGQYSGVINAGYTLEIVKVLDRSNDKVRGAHISFHYKDISAFVDPLRKENPPQYFIHLN